MEGNLAGTMMRSVSDTESRLYVSSESDHGTMTWHGGGTPLLAKWVLSHLLVVSDVDMWG